MTVKDNQPGLLTDVTTFFSRVPGPGQDLRGIQATTKAHGRLETRTLWASADAKRYLDWPGVEQALCLERRVIRLATGEISTETVYGITSLAPDQLDLSKVLERWRGHWGIENREHWVRDVIMAEDASRVHRGALPQVMACLRNAVISFVHAIGMPNVKDARRHFALNLDQAFSFICGALE
jgi:hypothetical protein